MMPMMFPVPLPGRSPDQERKLEQARGDLAALREEVAELKKRADGQAALLRVLFVFMRETHGLTEAQLLEQFRLAVIERAATPTRVCTQCQRPVSLRHQRCLYCGIAQPATSVFELI